jgi:predicted ATPase/Tfp pilus assembly protein PilF
LLLDNFEHLSAFAPIVLRIMEACRYTSILVTSRHRLRLQAEWIFVVSGLPIPETHRLLDGDDVDLFARRYSSLQLFRERAQRAGADFSLQDDEIEAVLTICRLLEGLPLGIELAAGLTTELSPTQIAAKLQRSHHILTTEMADVPPRHRSLQALFDFSWRLLSPAEQQMIAICAIFTDRFSGAAATAISNLSHEHLQALVQKSLLRQLEDDRFVMQPVVRQWAHEKLAQNACRLAETKRAYQNYFMGMLADFTARLGNDPALAYAAQKEFTHILAAWRFAVEQKNIEILGQNAKRMSQLLTWHGTHQEGAQYFIWAIECTQALRTQPNPPDHLLTVLGRLLVEAAFFHSRTGQLDLARSEAREAMAIAQQIGDRSLEIDSLKNLAYAAWFSGNLEEGETYIKEELRLARLEGDLAAEAYGLGGVAIIAQHRGLIGQAIEGCELALDIAQAAGETLLALTLANHLGAAYLAQGRLWLADVHFRSLLPLRRRAGDVLGEGVTLLSLSQTNLALGDPVGAARNGQAALAIFQQIIAHRHESQALSHLAHTYRQIGDQETAYAYAQQALQIADAHPMTPARAKALLALGAVFTAQGQLHSAQTAFTEAIRLAEKLQEANMVACARVRCARVLLALQQHRAAQQLVEDIMPQLAKLSNDWTVDPVGIYVQCYAVLNAVGNPTAHLLLDAGHRLLCQQAEQIGDESAKKRFLYNIPSHQEILRLWEKQTRRRAPTP